MRKTAYVGIDPGTDGALAAIVDGRVALLEDTPHLRVEVEKRGSKEGKVNRRVPDDRGTWALLAALPGRCGVEGFVDVVVALERVSAMPDQGVTSMFNFGVGWGIWRGVVAASGAASILVAPQTWKKALMQGAAKTKEASVDVAQRWYPDAAARLVGPRGRKLSGRADAILLARYASLVDPR
jgi:crossover junction endodeoxyribonuclease RuvC